MHHGLQCLHTRFQCLNIGLRFGRELFPHVVGYGTRCFHGDRVCYAETGSQALSFHYLNGYCMLRVLPGATRMRMRVRSGPMPARLTAAATLTLAGNPWQASRALPSKITVSVVKV